jgi:GNAT superfamily N-acetyltransferase
MYVVPAYRGSGVATQILDELEWRTRERGFERAGYRRIPDYNSNPRSNRCVREASA